jgi:hypothetical protein
MPYSVTACKTCDRLTDSTEHGPEDEYCEAPEGLERIDLYTDVELAEAVAMSLLYGAADDTDLGESVPQQVWDRLHHRGFVDTVRDQTGEGTTGLTSLGAAVLGRFARPTAFAPSRPSDQGAPDA